MALFLVLLEKGHVANCTNYVERKEDGGNGNINRFFQPATEGPCLRRIRRSRRGALLCPRLQKKMSVCPSAVHTASLT